MFIIGITGPTGAAKTLATQALQSLNVQTLDCDKIYHELLRNNKKMIEELKEEFPYAMVDGKIDRKKLSETVLSEHSLLEKLQDITHKFIDDEIDNQLITYGMQGVTTVAIDAIALIESGQNNKCDVVVSILAPVDLRLSRIMKRDKLTKDEALARINAQQNDEFYIENCDHILHNSSDNSKKFINECVAYFKEILPENM
ncbi:MAG: dephospho-CoA kinase [Oscillospiraceae bacterium]|nr:dephospho-CoA kinase [Oscillospiraceae bacterium]